MISAQISSTSKIAGMSSADVIDFQFPTVLITNDYSIFPDVVDVKDIKRIMCAKRSSFSEIFFAIVVQILFNVIDRSFDCSDNTFSLFSDRRIRRLLA